MKTYNDGNEAWDVVGIQSIRMESCPDEHEKMADP